MRTSKIAHNVDDRGIPIVIPSASPHRHPTPHSPRYRPPRFDTDDYDEVRVCRLRQDRNSLLEVYDNYYQDPNPSQLRLFYRHVPHSSSSHMSDSLQDAPTEPLQSPSATPLHARDSSPLRRSNSRKRLRDGSSPLGQRSPIAAPLRGPMPLTNTFNNRLSALLQEQRQQRQQLLLQQQQQQQQRKENEENDDEDGSLSNMKQGHKRRLIEQQGESSQHPHLEPIHTPPQPTTTTVSPITTAPTPTSTQSSPILSPVKEHLMLTPPKPSPPITRHKQHAAHPPLPSLQHDPSHQQTLEEPPAKENLDQTHEIPNQQHQQQIQPNDVQSTQEKEQQDNAKDEQQNNVEEEQQTEAKEEQHDNVEEVQHDNKDNPAKELQQEDSKIEAIIDPKVEESKENCNDTQREAIDPKVEECNDAQPKAGEDTLSTEQPKPEDPSTQANQPKDKENDKVADEEKEDESAKTRKRDPQIEEIDRKVKRLREYYDIKYKIGEGTFSTVYKAVDVRYEHYNNAQWEQQLLDAHRMVDSNADEKSIPTGTSRLVALKRVYCISSPTRIANEISILQDLRGCSCVAPLITAFRQAEEFFIVMPYIEHEDFRDIHRKMTADDIRCYMRTLLTGLSHLHARKIIHRDVKPNNFLYSYQRRSGVLIDFGLAEREKSIENQQQAKPQRQQQQLPLQQHHRTPPALTRSASFIKSNSLNNKENIPTADDGVREIGYIKYDPRRGIQANRAGTKGFRAPEILLRQVNQTGAIDIWSAGVILISLLTGRYPFFLANDDGDALVEIASLFGTNALKTFATKLKRIFETNIPSLHPEPRSLLQVCMNLNGEKLKTWSSSDLETAVDLLQKCLTVDCNERITAKDALQHPFLQLSSSSSSSSPSQPSNT
ncbi:cell cycle protein [Lichtheimia corymbifera JMRC:FSU:9682]|uniref:non-specific serine/threonine protein kinase n=1 Tax=Lichtheimia corymbifera JMRC:FSU:9682 TaxID=1263082 RepID=A0A068RHG0_9FUNG|nr:cell cycle protein [Lichtheimia corymbifera JMRC:FSU:9682]